MSANRTSRELQSASISTSFGGVEGRDAVAAPLGEPLVEQLGVLGQQRGVQL